MSEKLPTGWAKTTLGDICLPVEHIQPSDSPDTEFTYFDIGGIDNERNVIAEVKTVTGRDAPGRARQVVQKDDVLFSTVRTYLRKIARVESDYANPIASTGFAVIRAAKGISPEFLFYLVLSDGFLHPLDTLQSGSSYPAVRDRDVFAQPILLPPTHEQERIAAKLRAALSGLQRAATAANRAKERIQRYRSAVLHAALTGELTRVWRETYRKTENADIETGEEVLARLLATRRSRLENTESQPLNATSKPKRGAFHHSQLIQPKTDGLPELPPTWAWASLGMVAEIATGIAVSQNRFLKNAVELPYLRVANVLRGKLDLTAIKNIRIEREQVSQYLLEDGDILLNEGGDRDKLGRGWIWEGQLPECVHQNHVFRARLVDQRLLNPRLVSHWSNTFGQSFFLEHATQTVNLASINRGVLSALPIPIPPVTEQKEIVRELERRLTAADRLTESLDQQLARATSTRHSLLHSAMSGRLVHQDQTEEPANLLLEGISLQKDRLKLEQREVARQRAARRKTIMKNSTKKPLLNPETLTAAFTRIGKKPDARRLFDEAGCSPDQVVPFYEALRAAPEVCSAFKADADKGRSKEKAAAPWGKKATNKGRFRLVELWLEDFKNLRDYTVRFDSNYGLDVVIGWNGTGKSNLFEVLVIIFRDLHGWWERNKWPKQPLKGYRVRYEIDDQLIEVNWDPKHMKHPAATAARLVKNNGYGKPSAIARTDLPLPRFIFAYYSGPTNRLCEHFEPMNLAHYVRLREATSDDPKTLATLLEQRRFFCAETHHAKYVLLAFCHKEDPEISNFLRERLRITGFESALFIIKKPRWAKASAKAGDFWGAKGVMRRVLDRLKQFAIAPMIVKQPVSDGYRTIKEDHYYFFLPDLARLHAFAGEYDDARTFFLALESTDFSELIHDVKIQVRVSANNIEEVPITFKEMSEGEQQLLMVLGLMRFTKAFHSLVLLDEPDTHLNPHWSVDYLKLLTKIMSDGNEESAEQQTSQILISTHDPLVIASLVKEQIHLLKRDWETGACKWLPASVNPRGLGFTGILTSEMFGFRSDLDEETLADLDNKVRLMAKEDLKPADAKEIEGIDQRLTSAGFQKAFSDPYYAAFVRAWGRKYSELMAAQRFLSQSQMQEIDRVASEVLEEARLEVENEVVG